ncbi:hypothetical protein [Nonomuraea sp. NPDC050691]|uniref:hypothetical protein n=1 Tax=Nonomuraea sp. NPDC050691 TaxID=3155661 RepID=UPI0033DF2481
MADFDVAVIERRNMIGGVRINTGTIPTKTQHVPGPLVVVGAGVIGIVVSLVRSCRDRVSGLAGREVCSGV